MSDIIERRREARVSVEKDFFLELSSDIGPSIKCSIENISRLGVGFFTDCEFQVGQNLQAEFHLASAKIDVNLIVRVVKDRFVGAEFNELTADASKKIRNFLTPKYVASSIHSIAREHLAPHVLALYQGDDFEFIMFRSGLSGVTSQMQILWKGKVVEVVNGRTRFVPQMLMRDAGIATTGTALLQTFMSANEPKSRAELLSFFKSLQTVLKSWDLCPVELKSVVKKHLSAHETHY